MNKIIFATMMIILVFISAINGYLIGHNEGYDVGKQVGRAEMVLEGPSCSLKQHKGAF